MSTRIEMNFLSQHLHIVKKLLVKLFCKASWHCTYNKLTSLYVDFLSQISSVDKKKILYSTRKRERKNWQLSKETLDENKKIEV